MNQASDGSGEAATRSFLRSLRSQRLILGIYILAALVVTIQRGVYGFPNDYAIFRASFWNLLANRDLYVLRLEQAHDYFKYSPTFALLFAPFASLPFVAGLLCWNIVNSVAIFVALRMLLPVDAAGLAQALAFLPTLRSLQSSQSNALVAALIIVAFVCYERGWLWRGAVAVGTGAMIKIFPLASLSFVLPRPDRLRAILSAALVMIALIALPLVMVRPSALAAQYASWNALERGEAGLVGSSVMGLIRDAGLTFDPWPIQLIGVAVLVGVLAVGARNWSDRIWRLGFLGCVLLFCVIFNHRAERQSEVIAMAGAIVWFVAGPQRAWRTWAFAIVYVLVVLPGTDIVPGVIKRVLVPELRFAIPLTALWLLIVGDLTGRALSDRRETHKLNIGTSDQLTKTRRA